MLAVGEPPFSVLSNVSLSGGVREPATWALMIVGLGGLGAVTRRRAAVAGDPGRQADRAGIVHGPLRSFNSQPNRPLAARAPPNWAAMNRGADVGAMPAKVLDSERAMVTAGLANEVDAVNQ